MAEMKTAVFRQITNGWVVTYYIPGTVGSQTVPFVPNQEYEVYFNDIAGATAASAVVLA